MTYFAKSVAWPELLMALWFMLFYQSQGLSFIRVVRKRLFVSIILLVSPTHFHCDLPTDTLQGPTQAVVGTDNRIYVADGYENSRIVVFNERGQYLFEWGEKGFGRGQFQTPHGITIGRNGRIYVADRGNARIQYFSPDGIYLGQWSGSKIGRPWGVATGANGNIWTVDGGDQSSENSGGGISLVSEGGKVKTHFSGSGSAPGALNWGHALAVADDGSVVVADLKNHRLQKFIPTLLDDGTLDYAVVEEWPEQKIIKEPLSIAVYNGVIYAGQGGHGHPALVLIDISTGQTLEQIELDRRFIRPHGLSFDSDGYLYIADNELNIVRKLDSNLQTVLTLGSSNE